MKAKLILMAALLAPAVASADWQPLDERLKSYRPYWVLGGGVMNNADSDGSTAFYKAGIGVKAGTRVALEINALKTGDMSSKESRISSSDITPRPGMGDGAGQGVVYNKKEVAVNGIGAGIVGYWPLGPKSRIIARGDVYSLNVNQTKQGFQGDFNPVADPAKPITRAPTLRENERELFFGAGVGIERKLGVDTFLRGQAQYLTAHDSEVDSFYSLNVQLMQRM